MEEKGGEEEEEEGLKRSQCEAQLKRAGSS